MANAKKRRKAEERLEASSKIAVQPAESPAKAEKAGDEKNALGLDALDSRRQQLTDAGGAGVGSEKD
ncbi:hypothetical protein [Mesorhizobium caraganae]|uniref:hypothetical protein n=1 Tax=Mesorhizobium caraganae TaxID=483206 RepID=UPI0017840CD6|nr:hypothetical protein [Mesorhizobium caraganae]